MLSAVVITSNSRNTIGECIDALKQVCSDIIIVDSGSDDGTREICISKNIRYYVKSWEGYSVNKNFGNELALNDYILSIDSDEILSEDLITNINKVFESKDLVDGYILNLITNYAGNWIRYGGWNPDWHIRIFNRKLIKWEIQDVHEILSVTSKHKIKKLKGKILHYSYPTVQDHINKIDKYTDLFAERAFKAGKSAGKQRKYLSAAFTFVSNYIIKFGFLDGYYGFIVAKNNALYSYLKYKKLSEKHKH